MAARKSKDVTENPLYHDTWQLLKKYRDVVWSLELSVQQVFISVDLLSKILPLSFSADFRQNPILFHNS